MVNGHVFRLSSFDMCLRRKITWLILPAVVCFLQGLRYEPWKRVTMTQHESQKCDWISAICDALSRQRIHSKYIRHALRAFWYRLSKVSLDVLYNRRVTLLWWNQDVISLPNACRFKVRSRSMIFFTQPWNTRTRNCPNASMRGCYEHVQYKRLSFMIFLRIALLTGRSLWVLKLQPRFLYLRYK